MTKEPGTIHLPLTMKLRKIMLDLKYDDQLTVTAREFISQAIRSIHMEKLIIPALTEYDYIIQDRGVLSGLAYGEACGNDIKFLMSLSMKSTQPDLYRLYDHVIYLHGNTQASMERIKTSEQEFEKGDAIELKGYEFMKLVSEKMNSYTDNVRATHICIDGKNIEEVFKEILSKLDLNI